MLTLDDVKRLASIPGPCLTIMQPLRDEFSQVTRPEIRVTAALQQAEQILRDNKIPEEEREDFLRPLHKLLVNTPWTGRTGTFLLFRAPTFAKAAFWPESLPPRISYGDEFLVLPMLASLSLERDFWLLALSVNRIRLMRGSAEGLTDVALPANLALSLKTDEAFSAPDHTLANRSSAGSFSGSLKGVGFSTSTLNETKPAYLHDYFKEIDREIRPILTADPHPLIVAAVERELAIYLALNTWPTIVRNGIHGSPAVLTDHALFVKAVELLARESLISQIRRLAAEVDAAAGHRLLLTDPKSVYDAACEGRIRHLVAAPAGPWEELINSAALATISHGGDVTICDAAPLTTGIAGVLRYRNSPEPMPEATVALSIQ